MWLKVLCVALLIVVPPSISDTIEINPSSDSVREAKGRPGQFVNIDLNIGDDYGLFGNPSSAKIKCASGESYQTCNDPCEKTCSFDPKKHPRLESCGSNTCRKGCFCKPGYVRHGSNCILEKECPVDNSSGDSDVETELGYPVSGPHRPKEYTCGKHELFTHCGNECFPSCDFDLKQGAEKNSCSKRCIRGCFCKPGYVRSGSKCVLPDECPQVPIHRPPKCGVNEEFKHCGNECFPSCNFNHFDLRTDSNVCSKRCIRGCFCKPGFVRSGSDCILPEDCPLRPQRPKPTKCKANEKFEHCGSECFATCSFDPKSSFGANRCSDRCIKGCFCKDGYVRHGKNCIKKEQCPGNLPRPPPVPTPERCDENEEFKHCGNDCFQTCDFNPTFQLRGYLHGLDSNNFTRKFDEFDEEDDEEPIEGFGLDYQGNPVSSGGYVETSIALPAGHPNGPTCSDRCIRGCFCKKGYVRFGLKCISADKCPGKYPSKQPKCKENEVFKHCGSECYPTCRNKRGIIDSHCNDRCIKGCFCRKGYVSYGDKCLLPEECPNDEPQGKPVCRKNEYYTTCGYDCFENCDFDPFQGDSKFLCASRCREGCFCLPGYVKKGKDCVPRSQCDKPKPPLPPACKAPEIFKICGSECEPGCENVDARNASLARITESGCYNRCVTGCFCPEGFVRDENRDCIPIEKCKHRTPKPPQVCGENQIFRYCGKSCTPTCEDPDGDRDEDCDRGCVRGCFCEKGFVLHKGKCIHQRKCPSKPTPRCDDPNSEYTKCDQECFDTCKGPGADVSPPCSSHCKPGCACKSGYVKHNGVCILESECPKKQPKCDRPYEQYYECLNSCKESTCNWEQDKDRFCPEYCDPGCYCIPGFARHNGKCVPLHNCPRDKTCGKNEKWQVCGPPKRCEGTCSTVKSLFRFDDDFSNDDCSSPVHCHAGCVCNDGLVRDHKGNCVTEEDCERDPKPIVCPGDNEEVKFCKKGEKCEANCKKPDFLSFQQIDTNRIYCLSNRRNCGLGCFCKKNYARNKNNDCIPITSCNEEPAEEQCNDDTEVLRDCLVGRHCEDRCSTKHDYSEYDKYLCSYGRKGCVRKCFCKSGYARDKDDKCVPKDECSTKKPSCSNPNMEWDDCGHPSREPTCRASDYSYTSDVTLERKCIPGCYCKKGLVREGDSCFPPGNCKPPEFECKDNEEWDSCGPSLHCTSTCSKFRSSFNGISLDCNKNPGCHPGCYCTGDLIRNKKGECVEPDQCQHDTGSDIKCDEDTEMEVKCKDPASCERTCKNPYPLPEAFCNILGKYCKKICICKPHFVRGNDNKCVPKQSCGRTCNGLHEEKKYCFKGKDCERTCEFPFNKKYLCSESSEYCKETCLCRYGYVRREGVCVSSELCDDEEPNPGPECDGEFEEYQYCLKGKSCERSCKYPFNWKNLCKGPSDSCKGTCVCKRGFVRGRDGKCDPKTSCEDTGPICTDAELAVFCTKGKDCERTCEEQTPSDYLCDGSSQYCRKVCICDENSVRNEEGDCVPKETCDSGSSQCPDPNAEWLYCMRGKSCERTCKSPLNWKFLCEEESERCYGTCVCKPGYIQDNNKKCVPKSVCSITDHHCNGDHEVDRYCKKGKSCERTCEKPFNYKNICNGPSGNCNRVCVCDLDFVRNEKGKCIPKDNCAPSDPDCSGDNEELIDCVKGKSCERSCDHPNNEAHECFERRGYCYKSCVCEKGFIRGIDGRCKPISQCPPWNFGCNPHLEDVKLCKEGEDCDRTCEKPDFRTNCKIVDSTCKKTCVCKEGTVRIGDNCLPARKCDDSNPNPSPNCEDDEEEVYCKIPGKCERVCDYDPKPFFCNRKRGCTPECICKSGTVRMRNGRCGKNDECDDTTPPSSCRDGKVEVFCDPRKPCKRTCDGVTDGVCLTPSSKCTEKMCICPEGTTTGRDGSCRECPRPDPPCRKNEHRILCKRSHGLACQTDCFTTEPSPNICDEDNCIKDSTSMCICDDGFVPGKDGLCKPRNEVCRPRPVVCGVSEKKVYCKFSDSSFCQPKCDGPSSNVCSRKNEFPGCNHEVCVCDNGSVLDPFTETCKKCAVHECGDNEILQYCDKKDPKQCRRTCSGLSPNVCEVKSGDCKHPVCVCGPDYVSNEAGQCVEKTTCSGSGGECKENEREVLCHKDDEDRCQTSCNTNRPSDEICTGKRCGRDYIPTCICRRGYVPVSGICKPRVDVCDDQNPGPNPECREDQVHVPCVEGGDCTRSCHNPEPEDICNSVDFTKKCKKVCTCPDNYVEVEGKCVRRSKCPFEPECDRDEEESWCYKRKSCERTCLSGDNPRYLCTNSLTDCRKVCPCKKGSVRVNGKCVSSNVCDDVKCNGANEEMIHCRKSGLCERTCQFQNPFGYYYCTIPGKDCRSYCVCEKGYVRDPKTDKCVPNETCEAEPPSLICGDHEEKVYCKDKTSCENFCHKPDALNSFYCSWKNPNCIPVCVCRKGWKRNGSNECVPSRKCDAPSDECGQNEVRRLCKGSECENTCYPFNFYDSKADSCKHEPQKCSLGCYCDTGYYRDKSNRCVRKWDCFSDYPETTECGENEEYRHCKGNKPCENTCRYNDIFDINIHGCRPDSSGCRGKCACKPGFYRNEDGKCVKFGDCYGDIEDCEGDNEVRVACENGKDCDRDCKDLGSQLPWINRCARVGKYCKSQCVCKKHYARNAFGDCVPSNECSEPEPECDSTEEVRLCSKPGKCERTCQSPNPLDDFYCYKRARGCNKQCVCKKGTVRDETGKCVAKSTCFDLKDCNGPNEVGRWCRNGDCENTCRPYMIFDQSQNNCLPNDPGCKYNCYCKSGFYRSRKGVCVSKNECQSRSPNAPHCGDIANQVLAYCIRNRPCENTCKRIDFFNSEKFHCRRGDRGCEPRCVCDKGYYRNKDDECVKARECDEEPQCEGDNVEWKYCKENKECDRYCENPFDMNFLSNRCRKGEVGCEGKCVCEKYFARDKNGNCVPGNECRVPEEVTCGEFEMKVFCSDGKDCDSTCFGSEPDPSFFCPKMSKKCSPVCICRPGYKRNSSNKCVPDSKCRGRLECGENEEERSCHNDDCENNCFPYSIYDQSTNHCKNDKHEGCVRDCYCKKNYYRNKDGKCVPKRICRADFPEVPKCNLANNEVLRRCKQGKPCENSCKFPNIFDSYERQCNLKDHGCDWKCVCKPGTKRDGDGACVEYDECTNNKRHCRGDNEVAVYCQKDKSCDRECSNINSPVFWVNRCRRGDPNCTQKCVCEKYYARDASHRCIPAPECGDEEPIFSCRKPHEEPRYCIDPKKCESRCYPFRFFDERKNECNPTIAGCNLGCFCEQGYFRDRNGDCVRKNDCYDPDGGNNSPGNGYWPGIPNLPNCDYRGYETLIWCRRGERCENYCKFQEKFNPTNSVCRRGTAGCEPQCSCRPGYVRNSKGYCVEEEFCRPDGPPREPRCNPRNNEELRYCDQDGDCENSCQHFNIFETSANRCRRGKIGCYPECYCKENYYRNKYRRCVRREECRRYTIPIGCNANEEPKWCGPNRNCENTCQKPSIYDTANVDDFCQLEQSNCRLECYCKNGYFRNDKKDCVKYSECRKTCASKLKCTNPHEVYKSCGTNCVKSCSFGPNYGSTTCSSACVKGCFCEDGYVRHGDHCILPKDCPKRPCNGDEEYKCGSPTPITCDNIQYESLIIKATKPMPCVWGCFCSQGTVRNNINGKCVNKDTCFQNIIEDKSLNPFTEPQSENRFPNPIGNLFNQIREWIDPNC